MSTETILVNHPLFFIDGPLATITFNRPEKANAWHPSQAKLMLDFLYEIERKPEVRCVLIKANGKHFMAGGELELNEGMSEAQLTADRETSILDLARLLRVMQSLNKPVVASIQGGVVGAAVGLISSCDLTIAADTSFISVAHIHHGGSVEGLISYFLPRHVGLRKALEMALLGDRITAAAARDLGLINFVVPAAELTVETEKLVTRLCNGPTLGYGMMKELMYASFGSSMEEQGRLEAETYARRAVHTADVKEGLTAFLEKRKPDFRGR